MKGVFYSIMAMLLLLPILSYMVLYSDTAITQNQETTQRIIGDNMASFSHSVDQDLRKALYIYARRSLGNTVSYIVTNGSAIDNSDARLSELFMNNTIYASTAPINSTINEWRDKMVSRGSELGFDTHINVTYAHFAPYDSFNIALHTITVVNITYGTSNLYRIYNETTIVSIEDYQDPLYSLNTNGLVRNIITRSEIPITNAVTLDNMTSNRLYVPSQNGASFFDRMEGRLTASPGYRSQSPNTIGIESVVYQSDLVGFGITPKTSQTYVDYLYFDPSSITGYKVNASVHSWLRIDNEHAPIYNVTLIP